jgi:hypothetical protein
MLKKAAGAKMSKLYMTCMLLAAVGWESVPISVLANLLPFTIHRITTDIVSWN